MLKLQDIQKSNNVAELLSREELYKIGSQVVKGYEIDEDSRADWRDITDQAMDIAKQVMQEKTWPWPKASNIKFPLITQASIDYASRTLPEVIQNDKVVKAIVTGNDPENKKYGRASRISQFMSYQLTIQSPDWVEGTDSLLQILPVMGTVFKKTYYSPIEKRCISELCVPDKIVVNYDTKSLESARRVTHKITLSTNDVRERQLRGLFLEEDSDGKALDPELLKDTDSQYNGDEDSELNFLEQCCYLDLDEDGYKEPYVVTVHKDTQQVFRIVARFRDIEYNKKDQVTRIVPIQYYTDFHFIKSPDGGFYSMGFGSLLLPLNKAINTLINQLIDSGTLNNTQGGLIGRGLRLKNGQIKFKMGEWQVLDAAGGDDINKNIFPWPTKEPSQTLYQLLGLLMQIGKDLSSTTDVLMGKQPAQNVASNTISQLVEQGTKVFVAINKRVYRSLRKEYQKIYYLNSKYLDQKTYMNVLDDPEANVKEDFALDDMDVLPVADPTVSTETQRVMRASIIQQLKTADPREADRLMLESMQLDKETIDRLLPPPDPNAPPPPDSQKTMAETEKLKAEVAKMAAEATLESERNTMEKEKLSKALQEAEARIQEAAARVWKMQQDALHNRNKDMIISSKMVNEQDRKTIELQHKMDIDQSNVMIDAHKAQIENKKVDLEKNNPIEGA